MLSKVLASGHQSSTRQIRRFALAVAIGLLVAVAPFGMALASEFGVAWDTIEPLSTATGQDATSLKVFDDETNLYFLIEGSNFDNTNTQVFINIDGNASTGHAYWQWGSAGFEFLVENDRLFTYVEGSGDWPWPDSPDNPVIGLVKTDTSIEIAVEKALLGEIADTIYVGFVLRNASWTTVAAIPRLLPVAYTLNH